MAYDNFIEEHPPWQRLLANINGANTATLEITENGEYDVRNYAYADVDVSSVDVGATVIPIDVSETSVGSHIYLGSGYFIDSLYYGETCLVKALAPGNISVGSMASGLKCGVYVGPHVDDFNHAFKVYDVALELVSDTEYSISSMTEIEVTSELVAEYNGMSDVIYFTVPTVGEGHYLGISFVWSE